MDMLATRAEGMGGGSAGGAAGQLPVQSQIYSFTEGGFPPYLKSGLGQHAVHTSAAGPHLSTATGTQQIPGYTHSGFVGSCSLPGTGGPHNPMTVQMYSNAPNSSSGPYPSNANLALPHAPAIAPFPITMQGGSVGYSNIDGGPGRMPPDGGSALLDTASQDCQGSAQYSAELKDMPEAPKKSRGHRRSVSQPVDLATFSQPQSKSENEHWGQLEHEAALNGGLGCPSFGPSTSRDRKGARPPATAALAAIVAGAPLVGPDAAQAALLDPKRAKRILANRQSAARSKERKLRYITELERRVAVLTGEASKLTEELNSLQAESHSLGTEKEHLDRQLESLEQEVRQRNGLNTQLQEQVQTLKSGSECRESDGRRNSTTSNTESACSQ